MVVAPSTGGANGATNGAGRTNQTTSASSSSANRPSQTANGTGTSKYPLYPAHFPLSAREAPPLDLNTVERKGRPLAAREASKRTRPHGVPEAPTFKPTEEEWRDPVQYIGKIAREGEKYGIIKIIPPTSWNPKFAIDTEHFHFRTRRQELNSVEGGTRTNLNYLDQLTKFHKQHGMNLNRFPSVDKRPLDLYKLKKAVEVRGGFEQVCKLKKWAEIGRDLGYSGKIMSSLSTSLKNSYQKWLSPYEDYLRAAKPGVLHQLDIEQGGMSPSPANSPMNRSFPQRATPTSNHMDSPTARTSNALNSTIKAADDADQRLPMVEPPRPTSAFTAVNAGGGFTPVNTAASAFQPVNGSLKKEIETPISLHHTTSVSHSSSANTPDRLDSPRNGNPSQLANGHAAHLKRTLSLETPNISSELESTPNAEDKKDGRRSSKRHRKDGAPMVAGSHMSMSRPQIPRALGPKPGVPRPENTKRGERCESCGQPDEPTSLVVCDSCDDGYHRNCMDPPIRENTDWNCPKCLVGTGDYGFEEGGIYSLKQFQEKANNFKESFFAPRMPFDPILTRKRQVSEDDVEREFWRLVESLTETVEVEYGADIHSTTHGSGFPHYELSPTDPYSTDPWNLNILPLHSGSLFRHIKSDISGMTVPWLYVGMCFSTFCWHNEDHYTYSANYQHFGDTKTWYGIPGADAAIFERAMREAVPELFDQQPDLLFQLVTLLPPDRLKQAGVNVYALDQHAGEFVITFPQAYHAGFNHGFNFNEAVNFAPSDWEPYGQSSISRLQEFRRQPCFSHDELLLTAAGRDTTIETAKWLGPALRRLQTRELQQRQDFLRRHLDYNDHYCKIFGDAHAEAQGHCTLHFDKDELELPEEEYVCTYCKTYAYLSRYQCRQSGRVICLLHAGVFDCCGADIQQRHTSAEHTLRYRFSDEEIKSTVSRIIERARAPEAWQEKLDRVVDDEDKPQLKTLRSLVSEGERIPYAVPGLVELKAYVERCNDWIEEATNYTARKQQNRRKNDRVWRKGSLKSTDNSEREHRSIESIYKLLDEADDLSFDDQVITTLQEKADEITEFRRNAAKLLRMGAQSTEEIETLIEESKSFNVDVPEIDQLESIAKQLKWKDKAKEMHRSTQTLKEVETLLGEGRALGMPADNEHVVFWTGLKDRAEQWEKKAKELVAAESVNHHQLDALSSQAATLPVSQETRQTIDQILAKQREAEKQIISLYEKSKAPDLLQRPRYKTVRDVVDSLQEFNSKPNGFMDLEKEIKRHEDWMRRGKKLFGKANAPLHILLSHMTLVRDRNENCLDLNEKPRMPAEPASRDQSPEEGYKASDPKEVFCICRQPEGGMMIECELCHEWYHGKCLKIARGKIKPDDKYTCPVCDWRVKIPRDAARPKLEELQDWHAELPGLPFQPDEEQILEDLVSTGQEFRDHVRPLLNPLLSTPDEITTQRFYLRKVEGADILLAQETNFFRQELHKWVPVASDAPPILESSLSTRKPRPTKQQKMMAQLGIDNPEDLPVQLRTKAHTFKTRKASNSELSKAVPLQPAPLAKSVSMLPGARNSSGNRTSSVGNTPQTPNAPANALREPPQTANPKELGNQSPAHGWQTKMSGQPSPGVPQSPIFRPTTPNSAERAARMQIDPDLFSPSTSSLAAAALRDVTGGPPMSLASPMRESYAHTHSSSGGGSGGNMDKLFADFTTGSDGEKEPNEAGEALELVDRPGSSHSTDPHGLKEERAMLGEGLDMH